MRRSNIIFTLFFVVAAGTIPLVQTLLEVKDKERPYLTNVFTNIPHEKFLREFEEELESRSFAGNSLRPLLQKIRVKFGDLGPKAVLGRDGWLFYTPDVDYLIGRDYDHPSVLNPGIGKAPAKDWDVIEAIVDFRNQLKARGIDLLVVPVPGKPSIYPEKLARKYKANQTELFSRTHKILNRLQDQGVETIDLFPLFLQEKQNPGSRYLEDIYLKRDTHWNARALRVAARAMAARVQSTPWYDSIPKTEYTLVEKQVLRNGDIGEMTNLPGRREMFPPETTLAFQVVKKDGGAQYRNAKKSPVLFLGDSFSRIYHRDAPQSAGVVAHIAYELSMPLRAVISDGGASTMVRDELAQKPELLQGTKLVIWEFVERDIRFGMDGWKKVPLAK